MRVYLAAPWKHRAAMPNIAAQFEAAGHTITERWWEHRDVDLTNPRYHNELEDQAVRDYLGVTYADVLVVINSDTSEGKNVEMGIAIARFMPIILVGKRSNIFHFTPSVSVDKDIPAAIRRLAA